MVARMRTHLWILFVFACSSEAKEPDVEDPACAGEATPPSARSEGPAWDLDRGFDSDRPVCAADNPACDFLPGEDITDIDEDDLVLTPFGLSDPLSGGKYRTWPNGRIPYKYARTNGVIQVNAATRTVLGQAMTNWEQLSEGRIKFRPAKSTDKAYVLIKQGAPLVRPFVGYRAGQVSELHLRDSEYVTVCKHELGHVIGLHHEHRRTDRLSYIKVRTGNIVNTSLCKYQFATCSDCKRVGTYDRTSVMHYRTNELSDCRTGPVLLKLDGSPINHYWKLSPKDLSTVATMYGGASTPPPPPPAQPPTLPETGSVVSGALCAGVVDASVTDGAAIETQACTGAGHQDWRLTADGQLRVQHSMQCAAVAGCSVEGAAVEQTACASTAPAQKWVTNEMELVTGAGKCLDVGTTLAVAACTGAPTQRFDYRQETETIEYDGMCVTAVGDKLSLAECDGGEAQKWFQGRGGFVTRTNTARCMTGDATLADCSDDVDQRWALRGAIRDERSGLCVKGGAIGDRLALATCDASPAQQWTFWSR
jgi:hypothetical protein